MAAARLLGQSPLHSAGTGAESMTQYAVCYAEYKHWRRSQGGPMPVDYIPRIQEKYTQEGYPAL